MASNGYESHNRNLIEKDRIMELDIIRGFALLGIFLMNIQFFAAPLLHTTGMETAYWGNFTHQWLIEVIDVLVIGKFYPIFSILFGIGFALFIENCKEKGISPTHFFSRRLVFLLLVGGIHFIFLWSGDILFTYAVAGFFLLFFHQKSIISIKNWAISLFVSLHVLLALLLIASEAVFLYDEGYQAEVKQLVEQAIVVFQTGTFFDIFQFRLNEEIPFLLFNLLFTLPIILALFLFGLYATKKMNLRKLSADKEWLKGIWFKSLLWGIVTTVLFIITKESIIPIPPILHPAVVEFVRAFQGLSLATFYMTSFVFFIQKKVAINLLQLFAFPGKLALTNYLVQTLFSLVVFYGFGFGLFAKVGPLFLVSLVVVFFTFQVIASYLWLSYFRIGPVEWLWRFFTYREQPPFLR